MQCFHYCNKLTSVTIPESVTSIGDKAFWKCRNLIKIYVNSPNPATIYSSTFTPDFNTTLYVPIGSKAKYQAAEYWKNFADFANIVEMDFTSIEDVVTDGIANNSTIYDLQGRKVAETVKGNIYIRGGKKFIAK